MERLGSKGGKEFHRRGKPTVEVEMMVFVNECIICFSLKADWDMVDVEVECF